MPCMHPTEMQDTCKEMLRVHAHHFSSFLFRRTTFCLKDWQRWRMAHCKEWRDVSNATGGSAVQKEPGSIRQEVLLTQRPNSERPKAHPGDLHPCGGKLEKAARLPDRCRPHGGPLPVILCPYWQETAYGSVGEERHCWKCHWSHSDTLMWGREWETTLPFVHGAV